MKDEEQRKGERKQTVGQGEGREDSESSGLSQEVSYLIKHELKIYTHPLCLSKGGNYQTFSKF